MKAMERGVLVMLLVLMPGFLFAQEPVERLREVLPGAVGDQVVALVEDAMSRGLPGGAVANLALEGVAKGRTGEEVLAAAQLFVSQLQAARIALETTGRSPGEDEIAAAGHTMALGVDGDAVSALAASAPSGRSLVVPLALVGALVNRGLPSDQALTAVLLRLEARASDVELSGLPQQVGRMIAEGMRPSEVGPALGMARAGFPGRMGGVGLGFGPPGGVPGNPGVPGKRPRPPGSHPRPASNP